MTGGKATKHIVETIAKVIFLVCAAVAIVAVLSITVYMFAKGTPALAKVGVIDLLFGTVWQPTANFRDRALVNTTNADQHGENVG